MQKVSDKAESKKRASSESEEETAPKQIKGGIEEKAHLTVYCTKHTHIAFLALATTGEIHQMVVPYDHRTETALQAAIAQAKILAESDSGDEVRRGRTFLDFVELATDPEYLQDIVGAVEAADFSETYLSVVISELQK